MKKENTEFTEVEVCIQREFGEVILKCTLNDDGKKFFINSNEIKKISELFGNLVAVYFSPNASPRLVGNARFSYEYTIHLR